MLKEKRYHRGTQRIRLCMGEEIQHSFRVKGDFSGLASHG